MYTNISTDGTLKVIKSWFKKFIDLIPEDTPVNFITTLLEQIIHNNILQLRDTYWRQEEGTAIGTSCAVNYANLCIVFLEMTQISNDDKFSNSRLFFKSFINYEISV